MAIHEMLIRNRFGCQQTIKLILKKERAPKKDEIWKEYGRSYEEFLEKQILHQASPSVTFARAWNLITLVTKQPEKIH